MAETTTARYPHAACDRALIEDRRDDACDACRTPPRAVTPSPAPASERPVQAAYDAFFRATEHLARVALRDVAEQVRETHPDATAMRIHWSDQGDYLEPCAFAINSDGDEDDDYVDTENASALDDSNRSTWEAYATGDDRRMQEAIGYVFPLGPILTGLAPSGELVQA